MAKSLRFPAQSIYQNLDRDKVNKRAMCRFWDGAARRASQEGRVIIVASPSLGVISALKFGYLQERSSSDNKVALSQALQTAVH